MRYVNLSNLIWSTPKKVLDSCQETISYPIDPKSKARAKNDHESSIIVTSIHLQRKKLVDRPKNYQAMAIFCVDMWILLKKRLLTKQIGF